ncbi:MAG: hypothetical protein ACJAW3_000541 [Lentimonas sp.]|jgi:membrane protein implicated in regulation of membrane protease activity
MIADNILESWLILGVLLLLTEVFSSTVVLLFASLSALVVGGFIYFGVISEDNFNAQLVTFLVACFVWGIALWIPIKKLRKNLYKKKYNDVVGSEAILQEDATYGKNFKVKWSGALMVARIDKNFKESTFKRGDVVQITAVKGTKLTISPIN